MDATNGTAAAPLGVLEEIEQRLAAITPEQFIAPPEAAGANAHIVCPATDRIKRLWTLREQLGHEYEALGAERKAAARAGVKAFLMNGPAITIEELKTPGSPAHKTHETIKRLRSNLEQKESLGVIVDKILWLEVRRQHPILQAKSVVSVSNDWSLVWQEESDDMETLMRGNLPEIKDILNRIGIRLQ